jgi:hypothetical protein
VFFIIRLFLKWKMGPGGVDERHDLLPLLSGRWSKNLRTFGQGQAIFCKNKNKYVCYRNIYCKHSNVNNNNNNNNNNKQQHVLMWNVCGKKTRIQAFQPAAAV